VDIFFVRLVSPILLVVLFSFSFFFLFLSLLYSCCCSFLYSGETTSVTHAHTYINLIGVLFLPAFFLSLFFCNLLFFCFSPPMIFFYHQRLCMCVFLSNYRIVMDRNRVNIVLTPVSSSYFSAVVCVFSQSERSCSSRFNQRVYHYVFFFSSTCLTALCSAAKFLFFSLLAA